MPSDVYSIIARGARYWFLLLMVIIVLRSLRWYHADRKNMKMHLKKLPNTGFVGEMTVLQTEKLDQVGQSFRVPYEGTVGSGHHHDIVIKAEDVEKLHAFFHFEPEEGLILEPSGKKALWVDGQPVGAEGRAMLDNSLLVLGGQTVLCLHLYPEYAEKVGSVLPQGMVYQNAEAEPLMEAPVTQPMPEERDEPLPPAEDFAPERGRKRRRPHREVNS